MQPPDNHITLATGRIRDGQIVAVTLYAIHPAQLDEIVEAFEKRAPGGVWGVWTIETAFAALQESTGGEIAQGAGWTEGGIDDLLAPRCSVGPALWFLKNGSQDHVPWPLEAGWIVAEDGDGGVTMIPVTPGFLAWAKRQAVIEETGRIVH